MTKVEHTFMLPDLGEGLAAGEIAEIHIAVGDDVVADQLALVIETTKASVELPLPFGGQIIAIHGAVGDTIPVGDPLLTLLTAEAPAPQAPKDPQDSAPIKHLVGQRPAQTAPAGGLARRLPPKKAGRTAASPIVRRLARELGVDLATLTGTGKGAAITADDVRAASMAVE